MKKLIFLILAAVLVMGSINAFAQDDDFIFFEEDDGLMTFDDEGDDGFSEEDEEEERIDWDSLDLTVYDYDHITVGNPTPLNGQFFTDLFGNATSDTDVRHLVNGYSLIIWDGQQSIFRFDRSVVSGALVSDDEDGNRTYLLTLYKDLYYSDGTPVTSWDYAFSVLFQSSPLIRELGGQPAIFDYLLGYEDYAAGNTPYLAGLKVPADNIITLTVKAEALPYFYELSRIAFMPYPIHTIAPGCAVFSSDDGAWIGNQDPNAKENPFTAELLRRTVFDPQNGYMIHPDPVSGPYRLLSYNGTDAEFEINPFYKGNEDGKKPRIEHITYTRADNSTMISELHEGKFALLNKVTHFPAILEGMQLCMETPQYNRSNYPRIGLTYLFFNPSSPLVQEQKVRQAIAYSFDTPEFISSYVGQFGLQMEGLYGLGQWMTNAVSGTLPYPLDLPEDASPEEVAEYEKNAAAWDELSLDGLTLYELDPDEAVSLLVQAGWTLNEQGERFDPETDTVRCKEVNGELRKLDLVMGYQQQADVAQAFNEDFIAYLADAGIRLTPVPLTFEDVVEAHNEHMFDSMDLIYLGDNFNISFDPALFFRAASEVQAPEADSLPAAYQELFDLADDMDHTEPREVLEYMEKWIRFQERFTELLPMIPVYSNVYFDFFTRELDDYYIEEFASWGKAIVPARMRSLRIVSELDRAELEIEMKFAKGEGELDLRTLTSRQDHAPVDYSYGALAPFPEEVRSQIPEGYRTINEVVSAALDIPEDEEANVIALKYIFQTPYPEDESVYVLFGIPGQGSDVEWLVQEGFGMEDGGITVILSRSKWEKLLRTTFAVAVVSK